MNIILGDLVDELQDTHYYAVTYGPIDGVAYYSKTSGFFVTGVSGPIKVDNNDGNDMCVHKDLGSHYDIFRNT